MNPAAPPGRLPVCRECGCALPPTAIASGVCTAIACRVRAAQAVGRAEQQRRRHAAEALRDRHPGAAGRSDTAQTPVFAVPNLRAPSLPSPRRRRQAFVEGLNALILQAQAQAEPGVADPSAQPPTEPADATDPAVYAAADAAMLAACTLCRGACCASGAANLAWLSTATVHRVLSQQPAGADEAIAERWLQHLPARSVRGSCLFHTVRGCALPRTLRSEVCNRFLCPDLRDFRSGLTPTGPVRAFFHTRLPDGRLEGRFSDA